MNREVLQPLQYLLVTCTPTELRITTVSEGFIQSFITIIRPKYVFTFIYGEDDCSEEIEYDGKCGAPENP